LYPDNRDLLSFPTRRSSDLPFNMNGYQFHITASIGVALYPEAGTDVDTLMVHADTAMYKAKQSGKNRYAIYTVDMHTKSREKIIDRKSTRLNSSHVKISYAV